MKRFLLATCSALCYLGISAQAPEDILRYSYFPQHGSARNMAIGGAMGSLGGDINALFVNPAGLGLYKTRELVISPGFGFNNNKANYRGVNTTAQKSGFDLGTTGMVFGYHNPYSKWTSQAFSFGINQTANFNNVVSYSGTNNKSSFSEQYAEEISANHINLSGNLDDPRFAYGSNPAIYTYLVDVFKIKNPNGPDSIDAVQGLPEKLLEKGILLNQEKTVKTRGGIYELALGYAANMDDKFYVGGSLGIPIVNYQRFTSFREADASGNNNNNFDYLQYNDTLSTKGFGVNLRLGAIYKPADFLRLGLSVQTPTYYSLTDKEASLLSTSTENYLTTPPSVRNASSRLFTGGTEGSTKYTSTTPWKLVMSASYVFREINDTRKQRAFITADIEYVGYSGSNFRADGQMITTEDQQYYKDLKAVINQQYKGALNYRLGGELKFNTIMFRLGGAYYSNPYQDAQLKSNIVQGTGGIGYRNHGIFIDLTYVHNLTKDVNFPYRLSDKANTYAVQQNMRGNIMMTLGFKL